MLQIVKEVAQSNPSASIEQLSDAIVNSMESALVDIVQRVKTPRTPSPIQMGARRYRLERMPKKGKSRLKELTVEQDQFVREIALLRRLLDGSSSPNLARLVLETDQDSRLDPMPIVSTHTLLRPLERIDGIPSADLSFEQRGKLPQRIRSISPYLSSVREDRDLNRFVLNSEVEDKIGSDLVFGEFFRVVEATVRRFTATSALSWEFESSIPNDVETPSWKRTVLRIKPRDTDFEKSMELWDLVDAEVRTAIDLLISKAHPTASQKMTELNKNLFLEMDLG